MIDAFYINFVKMSLENAFNISLRKKVCKRDFAYIYTACVLCFRLNEDIKNNKEMYYLYSNEIDKMYHRAIILFSRSYDKFDK